MFWEQYNATTTRVKNKLLLLICSMFSVFIQSSAHFNAHALLATKQVDEMSYARFWPRKWQGGVEAFYNFDGEGIPDETIELMENSYYFEMIQFPVHHNVIGILWLDAWDNKGR